MKLEIGIFVLLGAAEGLKINYEKHHSHDLLEASTVHSKPWRARGVHNENQVLRLNKYLAVSRAFSEAITLKPKDDESRSQDKKKCNKKCKEKKKEEKKKKEETSKQGAGTKKASTQIFEGKFCAQGEKSSGTAISTYTYKSDGDSDAVWKINETAICYVADCSGRCDRVDPSVKFECVGATDEEIKEADKSKFSKLKATWYVQEDCKETIKKVEGKDDESDAAEYTYSPEAVIISNSGSQGKFCWGTDQSGNPDFNNVDTDNYYSYSTTQKLPTCPPGK